MEFIFLVFFNQRSSADICREELPLDSSMSYPTKEAVFTELLEIIACVVSEFVIWGCLSKAVICRTDKRKGVNLSEGG
jgi:hypothetical protein